MSISKIQLTNFRNFKKKTLIFSEGTTVIIGPNASGKTNILESMFVLSTGKSFRAKVEEEVVNYKADIARVKGKVDGLILEAVLTRGLLDIGNGKPEKIARKKLIVAGVSKRLIDFAGNFKVVVFGPWDMDLVTESPSIRRKFLDYVISQVDREYRRSSLSYEKGLRQRNKLLLRTREEGLSRLQLSFWDRLLIKNGDYISQKRREFIEFVNLHKSLASNHNTLEYDKSAISEARLEQYAEEEVAAATTLVGPHRDDFIFKMGKRDLSRYGSRGQQRMAILWLKLAELSFIEEKTNERPTLLLDDILSELDDEHRDIVMSVVKNRQTIITTADPHHLANLRKVEKIRLNN
ncbi:DNA replication/repair protein RecF [Patescibacteria group bacterium]